MAIFGISKQLFWTLKHWTQIYNLISVPQITRFSLGVAIISSKTRVVQGRSRRQKIEKVQNNKITWTLLLFIRVLYLKQQNSIL